TTQIHPSLRTAVPLPGRGLGTLAAAPIPRGARLVVDAPVLAATARQTLNEAVLRAALVDAYANQLDEGQRARVRGLAADARALEKWLAVFAEEEGVRRGWGADGHADADADGLALAVPEKARLMAAWETNCFGVADGECDQGWVAVLAPDAARLNHSCVPNAVFAWNEAVGAIVVQSIREVCEGEEVVIAYVDVAGDGEKRREALRRGYGF
ncbi:hypothetical protein B0J12DRAFT_542123, partial [Macrophomina phaseolina]